MTVGIVGPGRAGLGLALALRRAGVRVLGVHGRRRKPVPRGVRLSVGGLPPWIADADVVLLAVRDDALRGLVRELARARALGAPRWCCTCRARSRPRCSIRCGGVAPRSGRCIP